MGSRCPGAVRAASIGTDANLPPDRQRHQPGFDATSLASHGVRAAEWRNEPAGKAAFIELVTPGEDSEYWLGYQNFYVITRYNRSSFYAMSVFQLGEAVKAAKLQLRRAAARLLAQQFQHLFRRATNHRPLAPHHDRPFDEDGVRHERIQPLRLR
jgi:hypothetical protein